MPISNYSIDLTKIPFGGAHCGILVYEENNSDGTNIKPGLYLGARIQGGAYRRSGGIVDIVPMVNGTPVPYTYTSTATKLTLTADEGEINIIIDTDNTARIFGKGVGIKLYSKFPFYSMMDATIRPGNLLDLNLGGTTMDGGRYMMKPLKGKPVCYSKFNPSTNGPEDADVELWPDENGELDFEVYMMNPDEWGYVDYVTAEEACASVDKKFAEYEAFYPDVPEEYAVLKTTAAYSVWLHKENPNPNDFYPNMLTEVIYSGELTHSWANAFEQPLHGMAMKNTDEEIKLIKNMLLHMKNGMLPGMLSTTKVQFQAGPPTQGVAVLDLLKKTDGTLCAEEAKELYGMMKENYDWWKKSHSFGDYRFSYNHRDELSLKGTSYNALEFPLETPDLYTLMIQYTKALAKLAALTGNDEAYWKKEAAGLKDTLLGLWNGEAFDCRSAISGERYAVSSLLACLPIMLGKEIDEEIQKKICLDLEENYLSEAGFRSESKLSDMYDPSVEGRGAVVMWLQELIVYGLDEAGEQTLLMKAAKKILDYAKAGGAAAVIAPEGTPVVYRPGDAFNAITGSALLYIASKL